MSRRKENRSSQAGTDSRCPLTLDMFGGVGGRQGSPRHPRGGGGYQNKCTVLNFDAQAAEKKRDPRLEELREMGLQRVWLEVAEREGVDAFLRIWRIIDADADRSDIADTGRILLPLRRYSSYLKFQRNRYIETLFGMGMKARQIHELMTKQAIEVSVRHIDNVIHKHVRVERGTWPLRKNKCVKK